MEFLKSAVEHVYIHGEVFNRWCDRENVEYNGMGFTDHDMKITLTNAEFFSEFHIPSLDNSPTIYAIVIYDEGYVSAESFVDITKGVSFTILNNFLFISEDGGPSIYAINLKRCVVNIDCLNRGTINIYRVPISECDDMKYPALFKRLDTYYLWLNPYVFPIDYTSYDAADKSQHIVCDARAKRFSTIARHNAAGITIGTIVVLRNMNLRSGEDTPSVYYVMDDISCNPGDVGTGWRWGLQLADVFTATTVDVSTDVLIDTILEVCPPNTVCADDNFIYKVSAEYEGPMSESRFYKIALKDGDIQKFKENGNDIIFLQNGHYVHMKGNEKHV